MFRVWLALRPLCVCLQSSRLLRLDRLQLCVMDSLQHSLASSMKRLQTAGADLKEAAYAHKVLNNQRIVASYQWLIFMCV